MSGTATCAPGFAPSPKGSALFGYFFFPFFPRTLSRSASNSGVVSPIVRLLLWMMSSPRLRSILITTGLELPGLDMMR